MPPMNFVTFTGADEHTPLDALLALAANPRVELGLLYTYDPEGRHRYMTRKLLRDIAARIGEIGNLAIHVCGQRARQEMAAREIDDVLKYAHRIQVNGPITPAEVEALCCRYPDRTIITQHVGSNSILASDVVAANHAILMDASGGRGIAPDKWDRLRTNKAVGFAGGLSPENVIMQVRNIQRVARSGWWIDMEGKLRDSEDWFNIERAGAVVALLKQHALI